MVIHQTQMIAVLRSYEQSVKQPQSSSTQNVSSKAAEVSSDSKQPSAQVHLSTDAQRNAEQQQVNQLTTTAEKDRDKDRESVTITTSIGHTESNQHLNKQQAIAIYQKIASLM